MMSPVQQAIRARNKRLLIAGGIIFGGFWLFLVFYLLSGGDKVPLENQPGEVAISAVSPVATPYTPAVPTVSKAPVNILHHPGVSPSMKPTKTAYHASSASGHASARPVYQTSSATVHSVGGGGGSAGGYVSNGANNNARGINASSSHSGAIYVPIASNALTAVGAREAGEVVDQKMGITARRAKQTEDGEFPGGRPDPLPDEIPQPVGDVVWPLMLLLTGAYAYVLYKRRKSTTPDA